VDKADIKSFDRQKKTQHVCNRMKCCVARVAFRLLEWALRAEQADSRGFFVIYNLTKNQQAYPILIKNVELVIIFISLETMIRIPIIWPQLIFLDKLGKELKVSKVRSNFFYRFRNTAAKVNFKFGNRLKDLNVKVPRKVSSVDS